MFVTSWHWDCTPTAPHPRKAQPEFGIQKLFSTPGERTFLNRPGRTWLETSPLTQLQRLKWTAASMAHGNGIIGSGFSTDPTDAAAPKTFAGNAHGVHCVSHDATRGHFASRAATPSYLYALIQP